METKTIEEIKNSGLKLIIHTAEYLPTSSMLPEIRKGVFEHAKKGISLAKKVGADKLIIHSGYREIPGPAMHLSYESLISNLKKK